MSPLYSEKREKPAPEDPEPVKDKCLKLFYDYGFVILGTETLLH